MATRKPETTSIESNWGELFDVKKIRRLAELMRDQELSELSLSTGTLRIRLRRGSEGVVVSGGIAPRAAAPAASPAPAESPAATPTDEHLHLIKSPMVGTFYISPNPEAPAFIKVGDHVGAETTVCIVEAMKVFNEIQAEVSGKIVAVLCENGEPVEYGQPLFKVDTRK